MSSKTLSTKGHIFGTILSGLFLFAIITSIVITSGCAGVTSASRSGPPPALAVTVGSLPAGTMQTNYSASLTASGGTSPYAWSLLSGQLPPGLSLNSASGAISGMPTQAGTFSFSAEVSDSESPAQTANAGLSITIDDAKSSVSISVTTLPNGEAGKTYSATLTATGGTSPYSWSLASGALPAGLGLSAAGGITGTPTQAGASSFTVKAADSSSPEQTATKALSITIAAAPQPPTVTTTSLPSGTVSTAYSATLTASGGTTPYTWSVTSGSLPAGLSLTASTGEIAGTPTTSGTSSFTVQVKDANNNTGTQSLSITISSTAQPPTVTTSSLPNATVGTAYSSTLAASGGTTPYTWSVTSGSLPAGLSLTASTGTISGTPTTSGSSSFTVQVMDAKSNKGNKGLSITVGASTLAITTTSVPGGQVNTSYSAFLVASGGKTPYSWSISSGSMPAGLTLSSAGQISGTPTTAGTSSFTVKVTDSSSPAQTSTKSFSITISNASVTPVQVTTTSLPDAQQGAVYSTSLTASGGTTPYTWSITSGSLPSGLSLNASSGQISGTPTAEGMFSVTVQVKDSSSPAQTATEPLSLTVNGSSSGNCPTGQPCGATASYCQNYTPPSTSGATLISSLPYKITSSGNYYLNSDLSSTGIGIAVLANNVDINLNGHTITYGTVANGSGSSQIGEYGILACNEGSTVSESLDPSYESNGYCHSGGLSASNVTVENGTIVQSPNASQYYDPNNCPGSGVDGSGCSSHHESVASDVINMQYTNGITIRHLTLTWQNVDSDGININWSINSPGDDIECNTLNDKVTQINNRAYPRGMPIDGQNPYSGGAGQTIQYNTFVGSPQMGINTGQGGTKIQYNDIDQGYYQAPPYTTFVHAYSNDYAIGGGINNTGCPHGGAIAYNYIHSVNGRGIGCIYQGDMNGLQIYGNYISTTEMATNGEYGPNGQTNGATWPNPSGCEIDGGRGFEIKESLDLSVYNNTFIQNVSQCGAGGLVITSGSPCVTANCPNPMPASFQFYGNTIEMVNTSGSSTLFTNQDVACYVIDSVSGNYSNYFAPFHNNTCISDGDYFTEDAYDGGDYWTTQSDTFTLGSHPLSSGCGGNTASTCGHMMHWQGVATPPADGLGYVFQDMSFSNGASLSFIGEAYGAPALARSATVQWSYTPTVLSSATGNPLSGATVTATDSAGHQSTCQTNTSGQCSLEIRQEVVSSPAGTDTLSTKSFAPAYVTISRPNCTQTDYSKTVARISAESRILTCR